MRKLVIKNKKLIRWSALGVAGLLVLFLLAFAAYSVAYAKKIYHNQYVGDINLGGKSKSEAEKILNDHTKTFLSEGDLTLVYSDGSNYTIDPSEIALNFDNSKTVDDLWQLGHTEGAFRDAFSQFISIFKRIVHPAVYTMNEDSLSLKIANIAKGIDQPEKDYTLAYKSGSFSLTDERKSGSRIDQTEIISNIISQISKIKMADLIFAAKDYSPQITLENAQKALNNANAILAAGDLSLKYGAQEYKADDDTIGGLIKAVGNGNSMDLVMNADRLDIFVANIAKSINVDPQNAKLKIDNGKVVVFQASNDGKTLDQDQTKLDIENALFARIRSGQGTIDPALINLAVTITKPEVSSSDISTLGVTELVGTATTDFRTSPENRVHNITIGAAALNGVMLASGEEFSTLAHLGAIDASSGYLQELVIKNDKTVPDYGGGLCQVSSTLFRAALNAGMKITERQNHSYRVSYYEPPVGMDATIFDPSPDFKFINNYDSHILIQSKIVGTKITFEFYGTKDNRKVEISDPVVTNITEPPSAVRVETDTLPAGTTKQTQKAHQGATADFHYKVTSASGSVLQDKNFHSVYNAIAEQWLIGTGGAPAPTCSDGAQNGDEAGMDCGGSCPATCPST